MEQKIKVKKGTVEETLLLPLWGRATEAEKPKPRLVDKKAIEIIKSLGYDFSTMNKTQSISQHGWVTRSLLIDRKINEFLKEHPEGTVVNVGCGLETNFTRVDNGKMLFYNLDLPDVIELRKSFFEDSERCKSIASSFLDTRWFDEIEVKDGLLCVAGGVLYYRNEAEVKEFFRAAADRFKECDFYFDSLSPQAMNFAKKAVIKKGGMGMSMDGGWGLKPIKSLETWDKRFKVISAIPINKGMRNGLSLPMKIASYIPDILGMCSMVHLRMKSNE
ncbi:MAG: class I SAM-dependent methyltransferase [Bacteroidota bacterium]